MKMDEHGLLRPAAWPAGGKRVFLGDVAQAALAAMGAHEVPEFKQRPGYDEQRWTLVSSAGDLSLTIRSAPYWGFGLFSRCFLNEMSLTGPLSARARFAFDLSIALGREPWLPAWRWAFSRASGTNLAEHTAAWQELIENGRQSLREDIDRVRDRADSIGAAGDEAGVVHLDAALEEIGRAEAALLERNAPAVSRALGRAERALLHADPVTRPEDTVDADPTSESLESRMRREEAAVADEQRDENPVSEPSDDGIDEAHGDDIPFVDLS